MAPPGYFERIPGAGCILHSKARFPSGPGRQHRRDPADLGGLFKNASDVIVTTSASPSITNPGFAVDWHPKGRRRFILSRAEFFSDSQTSHFYPPIAFITQLLLSLLGLVVHDIASPAAPIRIPGTDWGPNRTELGVVTFCLFPGFFYEHYDDTGRDLGTIDCTACTMTAHGMGFLGWDSPGLERLVFFVVSHILYVLFFLVGVYHGTTRHGT
jgi:hypothetical protein